MLDPQLLNQPHSSKTFSVTFTFTNEMDLKSITNTQNWTITRANSTEAGYYNNSMPSNGNDVSLPNNPESVIYNPLTREATSKFRLSQNAEGTAVIDPSHIVFSFKGVDAAGREMDVTADAIDGHTMSPF
jgi:hypothetical protein